MPAMNAVPLPSLCIARGNLDQLIRRNQLSSTLFTDRGTSGCVFRAQVIVCHMASSRVPGHV